MAQPHYVTETRILWRVANNPRCRWRFTKHAEEEMAKDGWTADDIIRAVKNGMVILQEQKQDILWRVEGKDIDGQRIQVVLTVYESNLTIKVITAF
jgi:Domain of unknown function (DUF4258)